MIIIYPRYYSELSQTYKEVFKPINEVFSVIKINHQFFVRTGVGGNGGLINGNPGDYLVCMNNKLLSIWRAEEINKNV